MIHTIDPTIVTRKNAHPTIGFDLIVRKIGLVKNRRVGMMYFDFITQ